MDVAIITEPVSTRVDVGEINSIRVIDLIVFKDPKSVRNREETGECPLKPEGPTLY